MARRNRLACPSAFGGPYVGFLAAKEQFLRQMPGRLVGQTHDTEGRRGFVLTLATREQHIRREKATSNICTNQSLCALVVTIYLSLLGKKGLRALGAAQSLESRLRRGKAGSSSSGGCIDFPSPARALMNSCVKLSAPVEDVLAALREERIIGGFNLERFYPELSNHLLVCVTETVSKAAIDRAASVFAQVAPRFRDREPSSVAR